MKIIVAEHAGECFGVKQALDKTYAMLDEAHDNYEHIYSLGPLIHNPRVVSDLAGRGVEQLREHNLNCLSEQDLVIIRSHGVSKKVLEQVRASGPDILDATCPHVAHAQQAARDLCNQGYEVVLLGDKGHPEVEGIVSQVPHACVISDVSEVDERFNGKMVGLLAQTTQSHDVFNAVKAALKLHASDLTVIDTLCPATSLCQKDTEVLAKQVDCMLVLGGKTSANTQRLARIAQKRTRTYHVESERELDSRWFKDVETVGIAAGTSTPRAHIEALYAYIKNAYSDASVAGGA